MVPDKHSDPLFTWRYNDIEMTYHIRIRNSGLVGWMIDFVDKRGKSIWSTHKRYATKEEALQVAKDIREWVCVSKIVEG